MPVIHIRQWPTPVQLRRGKTILDAALSQGVPIPYQCRSGECGSCKCRVLSGQVTHDEYLPGALSVRDRASGWVLACRARPHTDIEIDYTQDLKCDAISSSFIKTEILNVRRVSKDTTRLLLDLGSKKFDFKPGQYVRLKFERLPQRSYSMANLSGESNLEFYICKVPGGEVSTHVSHDARVGDQVLVEGPFGNAYLRNLPLTPVIAVAGGSGLAPIMAIMRSIARTQPLRPVHLYFGACKRDNLFALEQLELLQESMQDLCVNLVLSELTEPHGCFRAGFVHQAMALDHSDLSHVQIYCAGPPPMVQAVKQVALERGASERQVFSDPFAATKPDNMGGNIYARLLRYVNG